MKKLLMVLVTLAVCLALLPVGSSNIQADGPTPVSVPAEENANFVNAAGVLQGVTAPEGKLEVLDGVVGIPQSVEAPAKEVSVYTPQIDSRGVSPTPLGDFNVSAGSVTVTSVWTTDGSGNNKSTFNCGDSIRYYGNIYNNTGSSKTAYFSWSVTGPCGSIASWSGNLTTANGNAWWHLPATIPSNACAGTYTYKLSVTYGGSTSYKSITFTVNCGGGVTVTSVWTTDGSGNNKTTFNCGDSIRYYGNIYNNTGSSKTAYFSWSVTGPCGSIASWSGNLTTGTGNQWWWLPATIPSNACAGTYTYKLSVTYGGSTSSKSTTFTVNCSGGSVTVTSVWTTDGSGNNKTTFNCGDSIRYYGNVYNNTGSSKAAYFSWSVTGPCGSIASWSGNLTTANGNAAWYLPTTIPSNACAGTYTYSLSVTYGGSTSSKSTTFTVQGGSLISIPYISQYQGQSTQNHDCGPTSAAMALEAYGKRPGGISNSDWIIQVRSHSGNLSSNLTFPQLEAAIGWYGISRTEIPPTLSPAPDAQMQVMRNALAAKKPVIALVHGATLGRGAAYGDHFVVVRGFSGDGQYVYINDPDNRCLSGWLECGGAKTWSYSRFRQACFDAQYGPYGITVGNGL